MGKIFEIHKPNLDPFECSNNKMDVKKPFSMSLGIKFDLELDAGGIGVAKFAFIRKSK